MLFDLIAYKKLLDLLNKKEKFSEKEENKTYYLFDMLAFFYVIVYSIFMLVAMIMFVMSTFKCSVKEGVSSIFFTNPYALWKFSKMIISSCETA